MDSRGGGIGWDAGIFFIFLIPMDLGMLNLQTLRLKSSYLCLYSVAIVTCHSNFAETTSPFTLLFMYVFITNYTYRWTRGLPNGEVKTYPSPLVVGCGGADMHLTF